MSCYVYYAISHLNRKAPQDDISLSTRIKHAFRFDPFAIGQLTRTTLMQSDLDQQRPTLPVPVIPIPCPCPCPQPNPTFPAHTLSHLRQIKQWKV